MRSQDLDVRAKLDCLNSSRKLKTSSSLTQRLRSSPGCSPCGVTKGTIFRPGTGVNETYQAANGDPNHPKRLLCPYCGIAYKPRGSWRRRPHTSRWQATTYSGWPINQLQGEGGQGLRLAEVGRYANAEHRTQLTSYPETR